jgi:hypothetical protein
MLRRDYEKTRLDRYPSGRDCLHWFCICRSHGGSCLQGERRGLGFRQLYLQLIHVDAERRVFDPSLPCLRKNSKAISFGQCYRNGHLVANRELMRASGVCRTDFARGTIEAASESTSSRAFAPTGFGLRPLHLSEFFSPVQRFR